jgi:hypothetical protein
MLLELNNNQPRMEHTYSTNLPPREVKNNPLNKARTLHLKLRQFLLSKSQQDIVYKFQLQLLKKSQLGRSYTQQY